MELKDAILSRKSIRGFKDEPVSKETLEEVLKLATRAVSALNSQPWEFIVLTGDVMKKIAAENIDCFLSGAEEDIEDPVMADEKRQRMIGVAKQLFSAMEIAREDKEKRLWWTQRGFRFFDAPAAILICVDENCDEVFHRFDVGAVTQNITLAAMEYGLGTCVELQAVNYQRGIKKYLDIPEGKKFIIGVAIGYPDWDFPANNVISEREDIANNTRWFGFEEE